MGGSGDPHITRRWHALFGSVYFVDARLCMHCGRRNNNQRIALRELRKCQDKIYVRQERRSGTLIFSCSLQAHLNGVARCTSHAVLITTITTGDWVHAMAPVVGACTEGRAPTNVTALEINVCNTHGQLRKADQCGTCDRFHQAT